MHRNYKIIYDEKVWIFLLTLCLSFLLATPVKVQSLLLNGVSADVFLSEDVSSKDSKNSVGAIVNSDILDFKTGKILVRRGTPVKAVVNSVKARGCGRPGTIEIEAVSTTAVDGQTINLSGSMKYEGKKKRGLALGLGIGLPLGTVVCFPWGFAFLAIKGENVELTSGQELKGVSVQGNYKISVD